MNAGEKVGKWTLTRFLYRKCSHSYWMCKCDCGSEKKVREYAMLSGQSKSCGRCAVPDDLRDVRFGKLVVSRLHSRGDGIRWTCKCDCGATSVVSTENLRSGNTSTCGCSQKATGTESLAWKGFGLIPMRYWGRVLDHAKSRDLEVAISIKDAWAIYQSQNGKCALSGEAIGFDRKAGITASLDRKDSMKGYKMDNVQWVHKDVNKMKMNLPEERFIAMCRKITEADALRNGGTCEACQ